MLYGTLRNIFTDDTVDGYINLFSITFFNYKQRERNPKLEMSAQEQYCKKSAV